MMKCCYIKALSTTYVSSSYQQNQRGFRWQIVYKLSYDNGE